MSKKKSDPKDKKDAAFRKLKKRVRRLEGRVQEQLQQLSDRNAALLRKLQKEAGQESGGEASS